MIPMAFFAITFPATLLAFVLFRFFDITKIWPACKLDADYDNAVGVMTDDLVAGAYAAIILTGALYAGIL